jgi:hypothetical protein
VLASDGHADEKYLEVADRQQILADWQHFMTGGFKQGVPPKDTMIFFVIAAPSSPGETGLPFGWLTSA